MNEQEKLIKKSDEHAKKVGIKLNPDKKPVKIIFVPSKLINIVI